MIRKIIHIDEEKCTGCGICAEACHEGAIDMVNGKAKLVRENFCDGFGDCLPACPAGAITFEEREAAAYDEAAVKANQMIKKAVLMSGGDPASDMSGQAAPGPFAHHVPGSGCPGSQMMRFHHNEQAASAGMACNSGQEASGGQAGISGQAPFSGPTGISGKAPFSMPVAKPVSRLEQWPVQLKLLPTEGDFYNGAKLLIAADCTAYAYASMHEDFMKGRVTVIGCPKLDMIDYTEKLTEIIRNNDIRSVTIVRMEVPCCGGLQRAAENALRASGKFIPWQVVVISRDGKIIDE